MGELFDRVWRVTVYRPKAGAFFDDVPNGLEIEQLRVEFKIEKNLEAKPNTSEITITNLGPDSRKAICEKPQIVRLDAGYSKDAGARHVYTGDLRHGYSKQENTEWLTVLQCGDGSRAYASARVNRSYGPRTSVLTVLRDAATSLNLVLPRNVEVSAELQRQFTKGYQLYGQAADELARLLAPFGYSWSIQDGRLQVLKDEETRADRAYLISVKTGLLGSPEFQTPSAADNKKGRAATLSFRTQLYPQLTPGAKVDVQAEAIKGTFRIEKVTHTGDSHGDAWQTDVEAKPV